MRRADEEPARLEGAAPDPVRRSVGGRLLVPLVVVAAAVVVLSTAAEGQARFTPFASSTPEPIRMAPAADPTGAATPPAVEPLGPTVDLVLPTVLIVLACLVALGIAVLLIRLIVSAIRARRRRSGSRRSGTDGAGTDPEVADAPTVLRGIAAALVALTEEREPSDAVVRAWLGLQQAAEDAGFARSAAETPTEFTGRVLSRTGADRVALGTLLRLYLRARFGDGAITAADASAAREALRALEASWERATAVSRG